MLTKKEIKALRSLKYTERQIFFIQKYLTSQKKWENMDKESSLIEILGLKAYNDYKAALNELIK